MKRIEELSNKKVIVISCVLLFFIFALCVLIPTYEVETEELEHQKTLDEYKDEEVEEEIISKRISGETSRENLLKIKDQLFSGDELNDFKCKIVNIDPYTPEDENYSPTTIYTVEMISTTSRETYENINLNGVEILIQLQNISGESKEYNIGDELEYNKINEFDSGWYIHDNQVLYVTIFN